MAKLTDGTLCRDANDGFIRFFALPLLEDSGLWTQSDYYLWSYATWRTLYDLAPPAPGKCFPCEVEL